MRNFNVRSYKQEESILFITRNTTITTVHTHFQMQLRITGRYAKKCIFCGDRYRLIMLDNTVQSAKLSDSYQDKIEKNLSVIRLFYES